MERLRNDPAAPLLVANEVGEPEAWVSLTGDVEIGSVDASCLQNMCARYWDLLDADRRTAVDRYLADLDALVLLKLRPTGFAADSSDFTQAPLGMRCLSARLEQTRAPELACGDASALDMA